MEKDESLARKKEVTTRIDEGWSKGWSVSSFGLHAGALQIEKRYEEQAYTKQHLGEKTHASKLWKSRSGKLAWARDGSCFHHTDLWLAGGVVFLFWWGYTCRLKQTLSARTTLSLTQTTLWLVNTLFMRIRKHAHLDHEMKHRHTLWKSIVKICFYLPLVANANVASRQRPAIRHGTFF